MIHTTSLLRFVLSAAVLLVGAVAAFTQDDKILWKNHYASTNASEYWAEGTQTWFWSNYEYMDGNTRVQTPEDLQQYDPKLYALPGRVYEDHHIPMDVYYGKNIRPARSRR